MKILGGFNENSSQRRLVFDSNDISPTLQAAMGLGGGQVPMIIEKRKKNKIVCYLAPINFKHKAGDGIKTRERRVVYICPALQANAGDTQATYVLEKRQVNGKRSSRH